MSISAPCGSGLARDSNRTSSEGVGCKDAIAGKPAPTVVLWTPWIRRLLGIFALASLFTGCASHTIDSRGYDETGTASYYGAKHHGKRTASGEPFDQHALTAAHRELPFGTRVKVTNLNNAKTVVVRINDRGPHTRGRLIDLSRAAADQLGMVQSGTARVRVQALSD